VRWETSGLGMEKPTLEQRRYISFTLIIRKKAIGTIQNSFVSSIVRMWDICCPLISMYTLGGKVK
jgi:hypothetical protein